MATSIEPGASSLWFDAYRTSGVYPVRDGNGAPVASIKKHWTGSSFQVIDAAGALLSTVDRGGFVTTRWTALDAANRPGLVFTAHGKGGSATLAGGREARVQGRWFSNEWVIVDGAGALLATVAPSGPAWSFGRRPWLAQFHDVALTTLEVVVLVQIHRLDEERRANDAAAIAAASGSSGAPA